MSANLDHNLATVASLSDDMAAAKKLNAKLKATLRTLAATLRAADGTKFSTRELVWKTKVEKFSRLVQSAVPS
jgi:hypothetical protein